GRIKHFRNPKNFLSSCLLVKSENPSASIIHRAANGQFRNPKSFSSSCLPVKSGKRGASIIDRRAQGHFRTQETFQSSSLPLQLRKHGCQANFEDEKTLSSSWSTSPTMRLEVSVSMVMSAALISFRFLSWENS